MLTHSESETVLFGQKIARELSAGDVVAFYGDLGAGKTTLIKGIIHALAGTASREIHSPTFTYMNIYEGTNPIYHFDLYRLKNEQAFMDLGFLDFFGVEGVCLIEWPTRITSLLPQKIVKITLQTEGETTRRIDVQKS